MEILRITRNNPGTKYRIGLLDKYKKIDLNLGRVPRHVIYRLIYAIYVEFLYSLIYIKNRNKILIQNKVSTPYPFSVIFAKYLIIDLDDILKVKFKVLENLIFRRCKIISGSNIISDYYSTNSEWVVSTPAAYCSFQELSNSQHGYKFLLWVVQSGGLKYLTDYHLEIVQRSGYKLIILSDIIDDKLEKFDFVTCFLWSKELDNLLHIFCSGVIMPLINTDECKLKCGFKALVGLSYGKPVFTDKVGFNAELIRTVYGVFQFSDMLDVSLPVTNIVLPEEYTHEEFLNRYYEILQNFQRKEN